MGSSDLRGRARPGVDEPRLAGCLSVYHFDDCRFEGLSGFARVLAAQRHRLILGEVTQPERPRLYAESAAAKQDGAFGAPPDAVVRYAPHSAENDACGNAAGRRRTWFVTSSMRDTTLFSPRRAARNASQARRSAYPVLCQHLSPRFAVSEA